MAGACVWLSWATALDWHLCKVRSVCHSNEVPFVSRSGDRTQTFADGILMCFTGMDLGLGKMHF